MFAKCLNFDNSNYSLQWEPEPELEPALEPVLELARAAVPAGPIGTVSN